MKASYKDYFFVPKRFDMVCATIKFLKQRELEAQAWINNARIIDQEDDIELQIKYPELWTELTVIQKRLERETEALLKMIGKPM